jgi:Zn-dependent metalloprotease
MQKLKPSKDSRTAYDEKTGAVRSFFGPELVKRPPAWKEERVGGAVAVAVADGTDEFLETNKKLFHLENIHLDKKDTRQGSVMKSVRYQQQHNGIPVYAAQLVVSMNKSDGAITSTINQVDYELPDDLTAQKAHIAPAQVLARLHQQFDTRFEKIQLDQPVMFIYRHPEPQPQQEPFNISAIRSEMLALSRGVPGTVYLVWQVFMRTQNPNGSWEILVDAKTGDPVALFDRRRYLTPRGKIFWPDPIRSKQDDNLCG